MRSVTSHQNTAACYGRCNIFKRSRTLQRGIEFVRTHALTWSTNCPVPFFSTYCERSMTGRLYPSHMPLTPPARLALSVGTALGAFLYPQRADLVAAVGELTGKDTLNNMYTRMLESRDGQRILVEKPIISDDFLKKCVSAAPGTFGAGYYAFMSKRGFKADERPPVRFVDNTELAYVATRYRQVHDFWHTVFGCNTTLIGETALKALEFTQTGLPMTAASVAAGLARVKPKQRDLLTRELLPWATRAGLQCTDLMTIMYEDHVHDDLAQLRKEWRVIVAPSRIQL